LHTVYTILHHKGIKPNQDFLKNDLKLLAGITAFDEYLKKRIVDQKREDEMLKKGKVK